MDFTKFEKIIDKIIFALENISQDYDVCITFHVNNDNELEVIVEKE